MTVGHIEQALQQGLWRLDPSFVFGADRELISTLTLGQIISGRVLRHYEGGRYGVMFGGQERVVDSAVPLQSGEIIQGRVVGLDDKVHLQRVGGFAEQGATTGEPPLDARAGAVEGDAVEAMFARYRSPIGAEEQAMVRALGQRAGDVALVASSALVLRKLGLTLDRSLIQAVARALADRGEVARPVTAERASALLVQAVDRVPGNRDTVLALADALAQLRLPDQRKGDVSSPPATAPAPPDADVIAGQQSVRGEQRRNDTGQDRQREWLLGRWVLNTQSGGAVAHRYFTVPLWLGERLVELNLAFFASPGHGGDDAGVSYKRAILSIELDAIGRVDIIVGAANRRVRITFETGEEAATEALAGALGDLRSELAQFDWDLDELSYATRARSSLDAPAQAVVAHHVRQDSLSRLL